MSFVPFIILNTHTRAFVYSIQTTALSNFTIIIEFTPLYEGAAGGGGNFFDSTHTAGCRPLAIAANSVE